MKIISLININKYYKSEHILKNINLEIENYKMYAIKGESGAGKSTLLNILGTLDKATSGEVRINGKLVDGISESEISEVRMNELGFIFQAFYLNPKLKASENIEVSMYINKKFKKVSIRNRALELLRTLGLFEKANNFPSELSGGEQQRVAIARALANDPSCILADEPTGNLDKKNEEIVMKYLRELANSGKAVVIVTHSDSVLKYADKVYNLRNGLLEEV